MNKIGHLWSLWVHIVQDFGEISEILDLDIDRQVCFRSTTLKFNGVPTKPKCRFCPIIFARVIWSRPTQNWKRSTLLIWGASRTCPWTSDNQTPIIATSWFQIIICNNYAFWRNFKGANNFSSARKNFWT